MPELSSQALIELAIDLTNSLNSQNRFDRLLDTVKKAVPCDAVVLLHLEGDTLTPLAQMGLSRDVMGRRFRVDEHPRFQEICRACGPLRFPSDCKHADPYDGLMMAEEGDLPVHACMGLPLMINQRLLGLLTLDSMNPGVFDDIPRRTLDIVSAMSAATLRTALLLEQLEDASSHNAQVVRELTSEARQRDGGELVGSSEAMQALQREISLVAPSDFTVLIEGETGVGKELVARTLHARSPRADRALVYVNCAAIPDTLIESELFGHVRGAFTGADRSRPGKFRLADHGTLFLDEIGELPLSAQSKLLRVLQSQEIQTLGQDKTEMVDVRILAATNRDLQKEVEAGRFRADLYHRLRVYPLPVPPLRQRDGDVTELSGFFCEQLRRRLGLQQLALHPDAMTLLESYTWPGNVRELEHVLSRAALQARVSSREGRATIRVQHLELAEPKPGISGGASAEALKEPSEIANVTAYGGSLKSLTENFQRQLIRQELTRFEGNWAAAARVLEMDRANLSRLAKRLGITVTKTIRSRD